MIVKTVIFPSAIHCLRQAIKFVKQDAKLANRLNYNLAKLYLCETQTIHSVDSLEDVKCKIDELELSGIYKWDVNCQWNLLNIENEFGTEIVLSELKNLRIKFENSWKERYIHQKKEDDRQQALSIINESFSCLDRSINCIERTLCKNSSISKSYPTKNFLDQKYPEIKGKVEEQMKDYFSSFSFKDENMEFTEEFKYLFYFYVERQKLKEYWLDEVKIRTK